MKERKKFINLLQEVVNLIIKFFKPYGMSDEMLRIPESVKRTGFKLGFMNLSMTVIALAFSFMLKITNMMIEYRLILLGIIFFMLYRGQQVVREACNMWESSESKKFELIFEDEIVFRGSQIIGKTADKVLKYDTSNRLFRIMSNEEVLNTIKNYLQNLWRQKIQYVFDLLEIISVIMMLIVAVVTNTSIQQVIFIPMIIVFVIISFFSSAYISLNREE